MCERQESQRTLFRGAILSELFRGHLAPMIHFEVFSFDFQFHFEVLSFGFKFHFEGWLSRCFRIQLGKLPQYRRTVADKKRKLQADFASVTACF